MVPPPDPDCLGEAEGDFQAGEGTEAKPYLVCTYEQLKKIGEGLDKHYELGNKIDASPSWGEGTGGCMAYDGSTFLQAMPALAGYPLGIAGNLEAALMGGTMSSLSSMPMFLLLAEVPMRASLAI